MVKIRQIFDYDIRICTVKNTTYINFELVLFEINYLYYKYF